MDQKKPYTASEVLVEAGKLLLLLALTGKIILIMFLLVC